MSIGFKLIDPNAAASAVFLEQEYLRASLGGLLVPHKLLLVGQWRTGQTPAPTPNVPQLLLSADHAATLYGLGSPLHIMAIAAFAGCRNVPVYALPITAGGGAVAATGTINPTLTTVTAGTLSLYIAGKRVQVGVAATDTEEDICDAVAAAINAMTELPVTATSESTDVKLDAKWAGLSGNDIDIAFDLVDGEADQEPGGITWVITPMATGATDPTIDTALAALDDTWYTEIVSQWTVDAQLDDIEDAGDARVLPGIQRPFAGFAGYNGTLADFLTLLASRNSAWTTLVPVDGSPNLKFEIAAAAAGVYAAGQQSRPGCPVRGSKLPEIMGGGVRWTYAQRDIVVKTGGSTFRALPGRARPHRGPVHHADDQRRSARWTTVLPLDGDHREPPGQALQPRAGVRLRPVRQRGGGGRRQCDHGVLRAAAEDGQGVHHPPHRRPVGALRADEKPRRCGRRDHRGDQRRQRRDASTYSCPTCSRRASRSSRVGSSGASPRPWREEVGHGSGEGW